jgi:Kef-type K+ transport system membrane component KefB
MVGIAMIPRGEVGLIFASIGKNTGVLNNDLYASLVLIKKKILFLLLQRLLKNQETLGQSCDPLML